jgi:Polyketide cyclase / dehydrase and lipid transport
VPAGYRFLTTWLLEAPREPIWDAIFDQKSWPSWWRGVESVVELDPGDETGVGSHSRLTWRSRLPYDLVFEARTRVVEKPCLIEADAEGELVGEGRWRLFENGTVTAVLYEWNVSTSKWWMNALAPALRPVFEWNHDWVMRNGGTGLADLLGCRLLAID